MTLHSGRPDHQRAPSNASTTATSIATPLSGSSATESFEGGNGYAVPWHGNTYIIIDKGSGQAITLTKSGPRLQDTSEGPTANNRWLCIDKENYFVFYNTRAQVYLGHDGGSNIVANGRAPRDWELMVAKRHPNGGYQLLNPYYSSSLRMVTVVGDGRLSRTQHGETLWEFIKVNSLNDSS